MRYTAAMATSHVSDGLPLAAGFVSPREAAESLNRSYSHIMHLLERGQMSGTKFLDRWLLSPADLAAYRDRRYGAARDLARAALGYPGIHLTARQQRICEELARERTCSDVARTLGISRQAIHAQLTLIRRKLHT